MPALDQLEIISPTGSIEFHTLDPARGIANIGRHPENDIIIDSPGVAPFQAILDYRRKPYQIVILSDEGNLRLDGQPLNANVPTSLPPWSSLEIDGRTLILTEGTGRAVAQPPPAAQAPAGASAPAVQTPGLPGKAPKLPDKAPKLPGEAPKPPDKLPALDKLSLPFGKKKKAARADEAASTEPFVPPAPRRVPRPPDQIDEMIVVEIAERERTISVEQTATFELNLANGGTIVAEFLVQVEGVNANWVDITPSKLNLNENEREAFTVSITPPRHPSSRSGEHHVTIVVTSSDYPDHRSQVHATVMINPYYEFAVGEISPRQQTLRGRANGKATLSIANKGNGDASFRLDAVDDERVCNFEFELPGESARLARQAEMRLPPEQTFAIPIHIIPVSRPLIGLRSSYHSYSVTTTLQDAPLTPRTTLGQIRIRPLIGPPLILLALLLLALLIVLIFRPRIYEFEATPSAVQIGTPVALSWRASMFSKVMIESSVGAVVPPAEGSTGQVEVVPEVDQEYVLRADNLLSQLLRFLGVQAPAQVVVNPVYPEIRVFSVDRNSIIAGENITLRWEVLNADTVNLYINGNKETLPSTEYAGSRTVSPLESPTVYMIEAINSRSIDRPPETRSQEIRIVQPSPTPLPRPVIQRFGVAPLSVTEGQTVTIAWEVQGATQINIVSDKGFNQEVPPSGELLNTPPLGVTNYQVVAVYGDGSRTSAPVQSPFATVNVNPAPTPTPEPTMPVIEDFRVVPPEIVRSTGATVQLVWSVTGSTTEIEITGPTIGTIGNLSAKGSLPVAASETTFFILTAHNGELNATKTIELAVAEPTPLPPPSPTPLPDPNIEYFVLVSAGGDGDEVIPLTQTTSLRYQVAYGTNAILRWSVQNASKVTLLFNSVSMGDRPAQWEENLNVTLAGTYQLLAVNEANVEQSSYLQIVLKPLTPPPVPYNVSGPAQPSVPLTVTWQFDSSYNSQILGFRIYRASAPYLDFLPVADETVVSGSRRQWADNPSPTCGLAYYVTAVYRDVDFSIKETGPSYNRYYTWPCPTPQP